MNLPTCWFCGETIPTTRVCPQCKQEFGECHSDPATHDCPGVQVSNPYVAIQNLVQGHGNEKPPVEAGYICAVCGMKVDYSSRCEECKKQFCIEHARPEDHHCPSAASTIPPSPKVHPRLNPSLADTSWFDQKTLIPKPAPPQRRQQLSTQQKVQKPPPKIVLPLPTLPKPPPLPKITISAAQTDIAVGRILQACKDCSEDPELHSDIDPILSDFILNDPNVLAIYKKFAQDQSLREKFKNNPLTRGLFIWFNSVGKDLDAFSAIGDEIKIPIAQLSLHELLQYYYAHLTDVASLLEARDTGGTPRIDPLEQLIQSEIGEEAKESIALAQSVIDDIAKLTREAGDRETIGFLIGTRDLTGKIENVSKCVPLTLGVEKRCFRSAKELFEVLQPLVDTKETVVGTFHSHPGMSVPKLSEQDLITHITETYRLSAFECLKQLDIKLTFEERLTIAFYLSSFNHAQIRYLLEVIFATIVFPPAMNPIFRIISDNRGTWEEMKGRIDAIIQKVGITPSIIEWPLFPLVDIIISPDFRFIGAGGVNFETDPQQPEDVISTVFYYHIRVNG